MLLTVAVLSALAAILSILQRAQQVQLTKQLSRESQTRFEELLTEIAKERRDHRDQINALLGRLGAPVTTLPTLRPKSPINNTRVLTDEEGFERIEVPRNREE